MKRTKFLIQSIFLTVLTCLTLLFTSCTGKIEGIYKFESLCYNQNGISIEIKVNEKFMNTMTLTEDFTSLTLLEDGNAILSSSQLNLKDLSSLGIYQPDLYYGTWKKSDDNNKEITLSLRGGGKQVCEFDGKKLKMISDGVELILTKKSKL